MLQSNSDLFEHNPKILVKFLDKNERNIFVSYRQCENKNNISKL
jgi:hypothetical protein